MDFLVEGTLQEGGIERHDGTLTGQGHSCRECHSVLLGNTDVDEPIWELGLEDVQSRARGHAGRHGHDATIDPGQLHELTGKVMGVVGRPLRRRGTGRIRRRTHVR